MVASIEAAHATYETLALGRHRVRPGRHRPGPRPGLCPVLVGDRPRAADERAARSDRFRRLLSAGRRGQPRRAGYPGRQPQPDERRAGSPLSGAGDGEPSQVGVPRQHVARAPDSAQRHHRLLRGPPGANVRRAQRQAGRIHRRHHRLRTPPALPHQRHPRPLEDRGRSHGARARPRSTCRSRWRPPWPWSASARPAAACSWSRPWTSGWARWWATSGRSARSCSTCSRTR